MSYNAGGQKRILPKGNVNGLKLIRTSASVVSIEAGNCRNGTDVINIVNSGTIAIDLSTSGAGGLDTGSEASSTLYTVYIIADSTGTNPVDGVFSLNQTTPTLPAGYDYFRRVGAARNNSSSNIIDFVQEGNSNDRRMVYNTNASNVQVLSSGSASTYTAVDLSDLMPVTSIKPILAYNFQSDNKNNFVTLRSTGSSITDSGFKMQMQGDKNRDGFGVIEPITDSAQSIDYQVSEADDDLDLSVIGYYDRF